ncbi:unnamed protein product [Aphanomyces euteiches]
MTLSLSLSVVEVRNLVSSGSFNQGGTHVRLGSDFMGGQKGNLKAIAKVGVIRMLMETRENDFCVEKQSGVGR